MCLLPISWPFEISIFRFLEIHEWQRGMYIEVDPHFYCHAPEEIIFYCILYNNHVICNKRVSCEKYNFTIFFTTWKEFIVNIYEFCVQPNTHPSDTGEQHKAVCICEPFYNSYYFLISLIQRPSSPKLCICTPLSLHNSPSI